MPLLTFNQLPLWAPSAQPRADRTYALAAQRVIEQLWPEYIRPVREGRIEASKQQQLYGAFKDKAVAAKQLFESGLQNHASLSAALSARQAH